MRPLNILFVMRSFLYLRHFESTIRLLASRGHRFTILVSPDERKITTEMRDLGERLSSELPGAITFGYAVARDDRQRSFAAETRAFRDYLRYRTPYFAQATKLAARARSWASPLAQGVLDSRFFARDRVNRRIDGWLARLEETVPPDPNILQQLQEQGPDLLLATPVVDLDSDQVEWIKAAKRLGIPTALPVASWDNLTNKGVIHAVPDRVIVWNEFQRREAVSLHGVTPHAIEITGAQLYDQWFDRLPSRDYKSFCAEFGFDARQKTILYVGSTIFIARDETGFVRRWISALRREGGPAVRSANILVRPHPMHQGPFKDFDVSGFGQCTIYPREGGLPVHEAARADYFDALYHCAAVVGINTSALVEASILGRRCFSVRDPGFADTQEGTLHFHYLTTGGLLRLADAFPAHLDQLESELSSMSEGIAPDIQQFVKEFIRPLGLEVSGTPRLADVIEATASLKTSPSPIVRRTLARVAAAPLVRCSSYSRRHGAVWRRLKRAVTRLRDGQRTAHAWSRVSRRGRRRFSRYRPRELRRKLSAMWRKGAHASSRVSKRAGRRVLRYRPSELRRKLSAMWRKGAHASSRVSKRAGRRVLRYRPSELRRKLSAIRQTAAQASSRVSKRGGCRIMRYRPSELQRKFSPTWHNAAQASSRVSKRTGRRIMRYRPSELYRKLAMVLRGLAGDRASHHRAADTAPGLPPVVTGDHVATGLDRRAPQPTSAP